MAYFSAWWPWATSHKTAAPSLDRKSFAGNRSRDLDEDSGMGRGGRLNIQLEGYDLRRNNCVAAAIGNTLSAAVVGPHGITAQANTTDGAWNELAEEWFREWWKIADFRRRENMAGLQRMAVDARLWAGDIFFLFTDSGQLQPIEASRIRTPEKMVKDSQIVDGVRLTREGIPLSYFIHERKDGGVDVDNFREVDAANICHIRAPYFRPDCVRPPAQAQDVMEQIKDLDELMSVILRKARMEAADVAVVQTAEGSGKIGVLAGLNRNSQETASTVGSVYEKIGAAKTYYLRERENVVHPALAAPGQNYVPYILNQLHIIGAALRIPGEFLMMHFDASFSASQVALTSFYQTCESWERWIVDGMMQRVWNWRIAKAIKDGELPPAPVDSRGYSQWHRVQWVGPKRDWLDVQKQAAADLANWKMGVADMSEIAKRNTGRDWKTDLLPKKEADIIAAIEAAKRITAVTGTTVDWNRLIEVTNSVSADATPREEPKPEPANA